MAQINIKKFTNLELPESCYILGFLWADATIRPKTYHINLEIVHKDYISIKSILSTVGIWNEYFRNRPQRQPQASAAFGSKEIYQFLHKYDYHIKSIGSPKILDDISPNNQHYFIRGFFDGDGSFYYHDKLKLRQITLAGSYYQDWSHIETILNILDIKYSLLRRIVSTSTNTNSIIRITGLENINKFGEYIYQGQQFGLERKKQKYIDILKSSIRKTIHTSLY